MFSKKFRYLPVVLSVLVLLCAGGALAKMERFNPALRKAIKLLDAKNYPKAEHYYQKSLKQCDSIDCEIKSLVGLRAIYGQTRQWDKALQIQNQFFDQYTHGRSLFYSMPELLTDRAKFYQAQGNLDQAAQDYQEAIRLDEQEFGQASFSRTHTLDKLLDVYEKQGKTDAVKELKKQIAEAKTHQQSCNDVETIDFAPFIRSLQKQIHGNWHPLASKDDYQIIASFRVMPDGSISRLRLIKPSGNAALNQDALATVQRSAPFTNVPAFCADYLKLEFSFDYRHEYW